MVLLIVILEFITKSRNEINNSLFFGNEAVAESRFLFLSPSKAEEQWRTKTIFREQKK